MIPNDFDEKCSDCEKRKAHEEYLASKRKYEIGEPITSLDELYAQDFVMLGGKIKHISIIQSMTFRTVYLFLQRGAIRRAIKKEEQ